MKKIPLFYLLTVVCFLLQNKVFCQSKNSVDEYANDNYLRYDDFTYNDSIKTVLLYNEKSELSYPIIPINGQEHLVLGFDDLYADFKDYSYSIIHCNANWTPSDLQKNEYISGFFEDNITDYEPSINTDIPYVHYQATFPNENFKLTKSGNYIIKVYLETDKEHPVLTKRFIVYENNVTINMTIKRATNVNDQFFKQEVDFNILHPSYKILDPFKRLNIVLMQNYRWDNAIIGLLPKFIKDDELNYDYDDENVFDGINEFRNFDIKSIRYQTIRVQHITFNKTDKLTHVYLVEDDNRSYKQYYSDTDINGNFLIKRNEGEQSSIEANYVKVHFSLPNVMPQQNGSLYLFGKFTDWKFKDEFKLDYDTLTSSYHKKVLLKQGYYNYMYCFVKDGSKNTGDLSIIEGSHSETENEYTIVVYYKQENESYDRVIGYRTINNR